MPTEPAPNLRKSIKDINNEENDECTFDSVESAIEDIKAGKMVIVADDEDRENEGDLVCAAEKITPEIINFMTKYARGLMINS